MKTISITGSLRADLGKTGAKEARKTDLVPCVMYGAGTQVHFTMDKKSFDKIIYTADVYNVLITVDGTEYSTFLKESQFHPVTDLPVHADFLILEKGKVVSVALPVTLEGTSVGVKNGGKLRTPMRKVHVSGLLESIPENVSIDISEMKIGQSIKVGTMAVEGLTFLDPESNVIVAVKTARGAVADDEEAEATEEAPAEAEA
jgi:large subunit ribosomal protein L25